ncbi:zonular occludens toxin domain-containing protein [Acinetobacter ursingii]|uniref:zonular occludens toxin domain-containing protein n=1 Tax=Acinetobacter ursingii TaxID=108980 RepID=UPI00124BFE42|nr:zonular occludens toxin domain-containing protein [Acinetobacter ursingii]
MALIRLTTGGIGAGKTYINVKNAHEAHERKEYQKIYSNIRGHSELTDYVTDLPDDWRECETGSLVIIDELQFNEKFSKHFSQRRDKEIVDITMIRHRGIDMWLITQSTKFMNTDIRELVNEHHYIEATGKKSSKAYCFAQAQTSISKATKKQAHDEYSFAIEDKYHAMYKSTLDGVKAKRIFHINMKLIGFIVGICFTLLIIFALMWYLGKDTKAKVDHISKSPEPKEESAIHDADPTIDKQMLAAIKQCQQQFGWSAEMCREGLDKQYLNNKNQIQQNRMRNDMDSIVIDYNPSKPFETQKVTYNATAKPVFSGCVKKNGRYVAYTQQGTILNEVSQEDCRRLIENGDRPFNYFAHGQNDVSNQYGNSTNNQVYGQQNTSQAVSKMTPEQYYKYLQYLEQSNQANNLVQDNLQRSHITGANAL